MVSNGWLINQIPSRRVAWDQPEKSQLSTLRVVSEMVASWKCFYDCQRASIAEIECTRLKENTDEQGGENAYFLGYFEYFWENLKKKSQGSFSVFRFVFMKEQQHAIAKPIAWRKASNDKIKVTVGTFAANIMMAHNRNLCILVLLLASNNTRMHILQKDHEVERERELGE